jgi:hypothetical protein
MLPVNRPVDSKNSAIPDKYTGCAVRVLSVPIRDFCSGGFNAMSPFSGR